MHELEPAGEAAEFNIYSSAKQMCLTAGCSVPRCGSCYTCTLQLRLASARQWFLRAGHLARQQCLIGLVRRVNSLDLLLQLDRLLQPTLGKDFTHSRSSANPSLPEDLSTLSSNHTLDTPALHRYIAGTWDWFVGSGHWIKTNYLLGLFQMCEVHLLHNIGNLIRVLIVDQKVLDSHKGKGRDEDIISLQGSNYTFRTDEHLELMPLSQIWPEYAIVSPDMLPMSLRYHSEDDVVAAPGSNIQPKVEKMRKKQSLSLTDFSPEGELPSLKIITSSFEATSGVSHHKDFLRRLPIHLAKCILGFLDQKSLKRCMCVSRHWAYLVKEIIRDKLTLQCIFDEVIKLQKIGDRTKVQTMEHIKKDMKQKGRKGKHKGKGGEKIIKQKRKETTLEACVRQLENRKIHLTNKASKKIDTEIVQERAPQNVNIAYAKICQIPVPRVDEKGFTIPTQSFGKKIGLGASYSDTQTDMVQMEERNVYCGPYNIKVIKQHTDASRVIHYDGGQMIAVGSSDGRIRFLDPNHSKDISLIMHGHTGRIRSLFLSEEKGFLLSGSYDLNIRRWDLKTASCMNIYHGHTGIITCLDLHKNMFASAGMDNKAKGSHVLIHLSYGLDLLLHAYLHNASGNSARYSPVRHQLQQIQYGRHQRPVISLGLSIGLAFNGPLTIRILVWDVYKGKCLCSFRHERPVLSVAINEMYVVSGCEKGLVHVWCIKPPSLVKVLTGHTDSVTCVSCDQWHLVSGSKDKNVKAWSMIGKFSECLMTLKHPKEVLCLQFLYLRVISGCRDGKIRIFDLSSGTCLRVMRATGHGDPVLSLHHARDTIVINTVSSVVKFQFEEITWDYTAPAAFETLALYDKFKMAPLRKQPYSYIRAQRMRRIGSTNEKIYHRQENLSEEGLFHHARFLSTRCMQAARRIQSSSQYRYSTAPHIDLQSETPSKPPLRSPAMLSQESYRTDAPSRILYGKRSDSLSKASRFLSASEQNSLKRIKRHRLYRPRTSEQIYLTVGAIHNSLRFDETSINTLYNNSLAEDWGRFLCPLEDAGIKLPKTAKKKPKVKISNVVDAVEPTDDCVDVKTLMAPFESQGQKSKEKYTFHGFDMCFTTKSMIKRSKSTLGFVDPIKFIDEKNRPQSAIEDMKKSRSNITIGSNIGYQDKAVLSSTAIPTIDSKLKLQQTVSMNPYRINSGFNLWTTKQLKENAEKVIMEHNVYQQRKKQEEHIARRKAWLKKGQGTELGPDLRK
ncbi:F-box/WD repeat-containing protein 10 [Carcharodon carcharias]|uniref:F-box/WD repeat-containing protein 10 n=1 Tax=Carcharodon carcharias TaxID=13397 RepID=UPI001B7F4FDA|nr:F-box/WD repeat-containing protein 10 [Carcharodon carcharias]